MKWINRKKLPEAKPPEARTFTPDDLGNIVCEAFVRGWNGAQSGNSHESEYLSLCRDIGLKPGERIE